MHNLQTEPAGRRLLVGLRAASVMVGLRAPSAGVESTGGRLLRANTDALLDCWGWMEVLHYCTSGLLGVDQGLVALHFCAAGR